MSNNNTSENKSKVSAALSAARAAHDRPLASLRTPQATFIALLGREFWPVGIYPRGVKVRTKKGTSTKEGKEPYGERWGLDRWTVDRARAFFRRYPNGGCGLCLGPGRAPRGGWLADVEGDGPEAEESRAKLFGDEAIETMGWGSVRGGHQLATLDHERMVAILGGLAGCEDKKKPGVFHIPSLPGLELRLGGYKPDGTVKQIQSVVPPTPGTDGTPRVWNGGETIAKAPESFYATLEAAVAAEAQARSKRPDAPRGKPKARTQAGGPAPDTATGGLTRYALAALADEAEIVATAQPKTAHDLLRDGALRIAGLVKAGALAEDQYRREMGAAADRRGIPAGEAAELIESALAMATPRDLTEAKAWKPEPAQDGAGRHAGNGKPEAGTPRFHLTDLGNAERLVSRYGRSLRYCHPWSKWVVWDTRRWAIDRTAAARRCARRTVRAIYREAAAERDGKRRCALSEHARSSEDARRIAAMLKLAEAEAGIPVLPEQLNVDPWLFNVRNGTIDLRTGELRPPRREDLITQLCDLDYDPCAPCPLWLSTLDKFFHRDDSKAKEELIGYWQRLCGYAMVGVIRDHILPIAYGTGSNGKSTMLGTLMDAWGPDYAMKAPPGMLMTKRGGGESHPTERADLFGKRLVVAIETESGGNLGEVMIKELTGGDAVRARRMREDFWEFKPTHTLIMATNHKPVVRGTDTGIWRRLKLIPFTVAIADADADKGMLEKLKAELPGILAWCVRGCIAWQARGLDAPAEVTDATKTYRCEQDVLGLFLEEFTLRRPSLRARASELYAEYKAWAEGGNEPTLTQTAFGLALIELGFKKTTSNGIWYLGLGLRSSSRTQTKK
jgi:P4 family phage/plasmid primase-like protien